MAATVIPEAPGPGGRWAVCQLGARMHYAVPRLLHQAGMLERFYTDIYAAQGWPRLLGALPQAWRPPALQRLLGRVATGLPDGLIASYPGFGLAYYARSAQAKGPEELSTVYLWAGKSFGDRVVRDGFGKANAVYAFNTAALEILRAAHSRGMFTVLEQTIAPRAIEEELLANEQRRHPGFEPRRARADAAEATVQREHEEWALADLIICGSEFVREGIGRCAGPVERCVVVPYGVDVHGSPLVRKKRPGPLRVLIAGQVCLRKGAAYALEVAKALEGSAQLRWVGPVTLLQEAEAEMAHHVDLAGATARGSMAAHYEWADVFFLPSVCEGSATVTYEARAYGLPVVTTPNAGSTVRDGEDGFIVPAGDTQAMAARLRQLHHDRPLLIQFGEAAVRHSPELSLESYQEHLLRALLAARHSRAH